MARVKKKNTAKISLAALPAVKFNADGDIPARILAVESCNDDWWAKNPVFENDISRVAAGLRAVDERVLSSASSHYEWGKRVGMTSDEASADFALFKPVIGEKNFQIESLAAYLEANADKPYIQALAAADPELVAQMLRDQGFLVVD